MFDQNAEHEGLEAARQRWERETLEPSLERAPEADRNAGFTTIGGQPIKRLYTPHDIAGSDPIDDIGFPGQYPYTRGIHPTGYRGRLWTMRMFAGFGTAEETNAALQVPAAPGPDRPFDRVRHADAVWPRHRPSAGRRRVRQMWRGDFVAGRYGAAARRYSARSGHHVDDDQFAGDRDLGDVYRGRREARHSPRAAGRNDPERYPKRVCRSERIYLPDPSVDAPGS